MSDKKLLLDVSILTSQLLFVLCIVYTVVVGSWMAIPHEFLTLEFLATRPASPSPNQLLVRKQ